MKDESPPPSQAKSDELQRAIVNLVEVANGLSSHSFEDAWGKVQSSMKHLRKRVQVAQANVQDYVSSNFYSNFWLRNFWQTLQRLVLGCIEAAFCKY